MEQYGQVQTLVTCFLGCASEVATSVRALFVLADSLDAQILERRAKQPQLGV